MLEPIHDLPAGAIGMRARGRVSAADYRDTFIPAVKEATAGGRKVRLLFVAGEDFEGYALGAMWDDAMLGMRHFFDFERIAFVSDNELYGTAVNAMKWAIPAEARVFPLDRLEAARRWLAEE